MDRPFLDYVLQRLPFQVQVIQTDNGAEFQTAFHWHVLDKGIAHTYIKPRTPRLNGKVERSHRIDAEEFYRMLEGVTGRPARTLRRMVSLSFSPRRCVVSARSVAR
ncbi:hypothetical protein Pth03_48820 [Planotetraspora thailandica]|uniref:Integrase catalytic domain-containing protein n=1 Tax=Planotetraspora thailandica TaxID=487172 RepID=A0A8J3XZ62_9ACTN|nr:DDE-type integrase/transposase/recombinase [Planotetraspora thailandica]GII56493.1 hypothetical protein Pth03_48820 [Planotetraspora thailandica]